MARSPALPVARHATGQERAQPAGGPIVARLRWLEAHPAPVVGAIVLIAAAIAAIFSTQVVGYDPDEIGYTHLAIGIAHSHTPFTTSYGGAQRLNQLYPLLVAPLWGLFGNVTAFRLAHVAGVLLMASAAIPTYLLTVALVRRRWAGYLAAALVALCPWMTLSTTELTEVAAFPACAWALLAMYRALAEPSVGRDALALIAIAIAAYGRLQLILLAPVLVVAMLVHELGFPLTAGGGRAAHARDAATRLARRHALLSAAAVVGLAAGLPLLITGKLASGFGFYGNALNGATINGATFGLARDYLAFLAVGLGAVPFALAAGYAFEALAAPVSRAAHAFASLTLVAVLALTFQVAEVSVRFNGGTLQERYLFYLVPLLAAGMCGALLLTRHPVRMVLAGTLLVGLLVGSMHYQTERSAFWYQVSPALTSFYDWIAPAFGASGAITAAPGGSPALWAGAAVLGLGGVVALLARRLRPARLLAVVGVPVLLFTAALMVHSMRHDVHGTASGPGFAHGSLRGADWVDRHLPAGAQARQLVSLVGGLDGTRLLWEDSEFWNRGIVGAYSLGDVGDAYLETTRLAIRPATGAAVLAGGAAQPGAVQRPAPGYLVSAARGFPVALEGAVLARSPDGVLQLQRLDGPARAAWSFSGLSAEGWLPLERPVTLDLFSLGGTHRCAAVSLTLSASPLVEAPRILSLSWAGRSSTAVFAPGQTQTVLARVCGRGAGVPRLRLRLLAAAASPDPQLTLRLRRAVVRPA